MTVTIKLEASLEERLRQRAAATGRTASDVVRAALQAYLAQPEADTARSAYALGEDLFGRHHGPTNLAQQRKHYVADAFAHRHPRRGG
ncbi:MAG: ribbon-helix-helix protein, CopG family [Burkholderiaceae bacterium]